LITAASDPAATAQGIQEQAGTIARGAAFLASNPAGAAAILNDNPRAVGQILGEAAATAAMASLDGAGGGCNFRADTPVATLDGVVAIGALQVGDSVLAFNQQTQQTESY
jgi:hypothetical protein